MSHLTSEQLVNFDTNYYLSLYPDLQRASQGLSVSERHLWLLSHFIRHGSAEKRKYRLTQKATVVVPKEKPIIEEPINPDMIADPIDLIKVYRHKYGHTSHKTHPPRDQRNAPQWEVQVPVPVPTK